MMVVNLQDAATTAIALVGAAIIVRRLTGAMRSKNAAKCEHCASGAAAAKSKKQD